MLEGPNNVTLEHALKFDFKASNNETKYKALIAGLKLANEVRARKLRCYKDSKLVQGWVENIYRAKEVVLLIYYHVIKTLVDNFNCSKCTTYQGKTILRKTCSPSLQAPRRLDTLRPSFK